MQSRSTSSFLQTLELLMARLSKATTSGTLQTHHCWSQERMHQSLLPGKITTRSKLSATHKHQRQSRICSLAESTTARSMPRTNSGKVNGVKHPKQCGQNHRYLNHPARRRKS